MEAFRPCDLRHIEVALTVVLDDRVCRWSDGLPPVFILTRVGCGVQLPSVTGANTMKIFAAISLISLACAMSAEALAQKPEGASCMGLSVEPSRLQATAR
jgi:hypothetical protein